MQEYTITLKHDDGVVVITTVARTEEQAIKQVLSWENAPKRAIKQVIKEMPC